MKGISKVLIVMLCLKNFALHAMEDTSKHVIVDLEKFLVEPNKMAATFNVGIGALAASWWKSSRAIDPLPDFFAALRTVDPRSVPTRTTWHNQEIPYLMYASLIGSKTCQELLEIAQEGIRDQKRKDSSLMLNLAEITFNPEKNASIMQIIPAGTQLLEKLKDAGHTIHILANWNTEALQALQKKLPGLFRLINGNVVVSGMLQTVKSTEMYQTFFEQNNISPEHSIVIETQQEALDSLKEYNSNLVGILCQNKNHTEVESELEKHGFLPPAASGEN